MADATEVVIRPVRPADREYLQVGIRELSSDSRYYRFFSPMPQLSDYQLQYFTEVDQRDHVAWIAFDATRVTPHGIGIGRFIRMEHPAVAEFALTVIDAYQHRGLGTWLLAVLCCLARARGISTLRGCALAENRVVLRWMHELRATSRLANGVVQFDFPVSESHVAGAASDAIRNLSNAIGAIASAWRSSRCEEVAGSSMGTPVRGGDRPAVESGSLAAISSEPNELLDTTR